MEQKLKKEPLGQGFFVYVTPHHTFGTDAVLLSNFASPKNKDRLVDLGTGCGIIPLLMLREGKLQNAVGVDISDEATKIAVKTVAEQNIENFTIINSNLTDLKGKVEFGCHTLVTCNPPYMNVDSRSVYKDLPVYKAIADGVVNTASLFLYKALKEQDDFKDAQDV